MVLGMSAEDVAKHLERVDKAIRGGKEVPDAEKSVNITDLYFRYKWGGMGPTPLPGPALKQINVVDRTTDSRWLPHFEGNGRPLGVYRTVPGYYWLLRFEPALTQHLLDHVGTAHDVAERYGTDLWASRRLARSGSASRRRRPKKRPRAPPRGPRAAVAA